MDADVLYQNDRAVEVALWGMFLSLNMLLPHDDLTPKVDLARIREIRK